MYFDSKKYTKLGRDRFASSIFVDDISEDLIDILRGEIRDPRLLQVLPIIAILSLMSYNIIGLFLTLPLYIIIYFLSERRFELSVTKKRVFLSSEYNYPRITRIFAFLLIVISLFKIYLFINPEFRSTLFTIRDLRRISIEIGFSNIIYFAFEKILRNYHDLFLHLEQTIIILINLWFASKYFQLEYQFKEFNHKKISEQLVKLKKNNNLFGILSIILLYFVVQIYLLTRFSFTWIILLWFIYRILPREEKLYLSIYGSSSRPLVNGMEILLKNENQLRRITAAIFDWSIPESQSSRRLPFRTIPEEEGSVYLTGLRASLKPVLKRANRIGLTLSTVINITVFVTLMRLATLYIQDEIDTVFGIGLALLIISIIFYYLMKILNLIRFKIQSDEALIIGEGFTARYIHPSLWILRGDRLEGTSLQRGVHKSWIKYDKVRGLVINYRRLTILGSLVVIVVSIGMWSYLGGINLSNVLLITPFIFDLGLRFVAQKAAADLTFFIISGYVLWVLALFIYPRFISGYQPSLYLEMQSETITPIILKDFKDHQDASVHFTKSLVHSKKGDLRKSIGRPGVFFIQIQIENCKIFGEEMKLEFILGDSERHFPITLEPNQSFPLIVDDKIRASGLKGYPEIPVQIKDKSGLLYNEIVKLVFTESMTIPVKSEEGEFELKIIKIGQRG